MKFLRQLGLQLFYIVLRCLLSLRYKIEVKGLSNIPKSMKGILFLPNHPAEMDPQIMMQIFWPSFRPRPLAVEHFYYQKGLRFFMDMVRALPLPTMDFANKWKVRRIEKLKQKLIEELDQGENFLIYPAGKLKRTPDERIGGASLIPDLLKERPEVNIVLVRTTGLWGSMFSCALTGMSPDFGKSLRKGFKTILKNGIFFSPRRKVTVEIELAGETFPRKGTRAEINKWLEKWYNKDGPEPLKLVSYSLWKEELAVQQTPAQAGFLEEVVVPEEIKEQVLASLSKMTRRKPEDLTPLLHLSHDLGLDSLDVSQLYIVLEERYDVEGLAFGQLQTVGDLLQAAAGAKKELTPAVQRKKKSKWPKEGKRKSPLIPEAQTLAEAFLITCERMGKATACADNMAGVLSYQKIKRSALVLSRKIQEMPGDHIGILLPASTTAYVVILGVMLAGKVPVMLNWTAGPRSLEHSANVTGLKVVLSSFRFLSRLESGDLGEVDDLLVLLEEFRREISLGDKLKGLFLSFLGKKKLLSKLKLSQNENDTAVVIFTSGTESLPKGVPLTHRNILYNLRAALSAVNILPSDTLYGVLPPFHSFGFSVTGFFPLIGGIRVCYAPDPTDSRALANDIEHFKPTIFCCAPSFVQGLLRVASEEQLESLRMIVTGAEKAPADLYGAMEGRIFLEGYGITECSPIVTMEREGESNRGVGRPIPGVELMVIDPETGSLADEGEICIYGPNIFAGYLGEDRNPFIEMDGKRWYRSGDRGYIDRDGTLILTGRLKRFVKIGGEMVSLGGIEDDLRAISQEMGWAPKKPAGPYLAVVARGIESEKPEILLYTSLDLVRELVNSALKKKGVGRLVKIAEVKRLEEIPLTGTGKTHYRLLDEL
ncbi:MAG: Bifunctional protein Aas [Chlamydiae bacterium]|nr:Bifunctional protein Aas [Chlamydiota bacterium]